MTDNPSPTATIGARLKDAREYRGFTLEDVAGYLGITPSDLSLIESGSRPAAAAEINRLATLYKTTPDHLTGHARKEPEPESVRMLARAAADISPTDGDEVLRFVQYLRSTKSIR